MKKILAMVLAMMLVLSMSAAFAAADTGVAASDAITVKFNKKYTVTTSNDTYKVTEPSETITFEVVKATGNTNPDDTMISIDPFAVESNPENEITINVPSYTIPGVYNYTVKEYDANTTVNGSVVNNTQGVEYSNESFDVQVLVAYNDTHTKLVATAAISSRTNDGKVDSITNTYKLGHLDVKKTISGNLASKEDNFEVDVTFKAAEGKVVRSIITYVDDNTKKEIAIADMADGSQTVTITLKADETVKFYNIPEGVTYTVKEHDYTAGDKNVSLQGYEAPTYNGTVDADGYEATLTGNDTDTVTINNEKKATVDTGIVLDNAPYMILMALVVVAGAALIVKRASANR